MSALRFHIEKAVNGGYGLARRENGHIVLIRHVLPGETVMARIILEKKGFAEAVPIAILEASPHRIPPPCPHHGICGGCDLQHCDYDHQLQIKRQIIGDLLQRAPQHSLSQAVPLLAAPLASPRIFGYRQRLRLQVSDNGVPGFRRFHSHQCVPITRCLLAPPELNRALQQLRLQGSFHRLLRLSTELELLLNPASSGVVCLFHLVRKARPADIKLAETLTASVPELEGIMFSGQDFLPVSIHRNGEARPPSSLSLELLLPPFPGHTDKPVALAWEASGFCQVNLEQNQKLIQTVLDLCRADQGSSVLDLFCGMGNFSIPLAMGCASLLGVEGQGAAIRQARQNSERAGLANTRFEKSPIHQYCQTLAAAGERFDCVVIDPPRQGAPELAPLLARLTGQRLIYISCDPATLCRDLGALTSAGFRLRKLQPVDMFPQTHHIETVALLEREPPL
jgi:23S rRNA (uracil1939-C5)-methyltransferase